jgi:hypothetical protein
VIGAASNVLAREMEVPTLHSTSSPRRGRACVVRCDRRADAPRLAARRLLTLAPPAVVLD